jgi:Zn-dependent M28 family amino/carboxypeptidase
MGILSFMTGMPGRSYHGGVILSAEEQGVAARMQSDLLHLSSDIGERNVSRRPERLEEAAQWIASELRDSGWQPTAQDYTVQEIGVRNIVVEQRGTVKSDEIVLVGAHYDSVVGCPGANDNGSGVVSLLAIARWLHSQQPTGRTVRLVFFVNEEPPWFQQQEMGSLVYARECHRRKENIIAMMSLETMGYFTDKPGTQEYPLPLLKRMYPATGNFIGFVGSSQSAKLIRDCVDRFRTSCQFPSEGAAIPGVVQGVGWSDHWSFQIHGYPALMVTDTAPFRYPFYHTPEDTADRVDYQKLTRVTMGLQHVVVGLANR